MPCVHCLCVCSYTVYGMLFLVIQDSSSSEEEDGHLAADEEDEVRVTDEEGTLSTPCFL